MTQKSRRAERRRTRGDHAGRPAARPTLPTGFGLTLALIGVGGAAISLYLTHIRRLVLLGAEAGGLCSIDDWLDCRTVLASSHAAIGGIPISVFATWFYIVTVVFALLGLRPNVLRLPRSAAAVLFIAYAAATAVSVVLAGVSATFIASFCPVCASLYALNAIALVVTLRGVRATGESVSEALTREGRYWLARPGPALRFATTILVALVLVFVASRFSAPVPELCELIPGIPKRDRLRVAIFSDFQCPHCRELHRALRAVQKNEDVLLELRHYPLDADCNPQVNRLRKTGGCLQARASICATADGRSDEFNDRLFESGPIDVAGLVALAESLGINASRFGSCLGSPETTQTLSHDVRVAIDSSVRGTPTLFVNGRRLAHVPTAEGIACLLAYRRGQSADRAGP